MNQELPRRTFFSALALSPLALLGLKTKPDDPDEDIKKGQTKSFPTVDEMLDSLKQPWDETADYWEGRALMAEFDLECMGATPLDEEWMKRLRINQSDL